MRLLGFLVLLVLIVFNVAFELESEFEQKEKYAVTDVNSGIGEWIEKIFKKIMEEIEQIRGSIIYRIAWEIFARIWTAFADFFELIRKIIEAIASAVKHFKESQFGITLKDLVVKIKDLAVKTIKIIKTVMKYLHIDWIDDIAARIVKGLEKFDWIIVKLARVTGVLVVKGIVEIITDDIRTQIVPEINKVIDKIHEYIQEIRRGLTPTIPLSYKITVIEWIKNKKEIVPGTIIQAILRFIKAIITFIPDTILTVTSFIIGEIHKVAHVILGVFTPKLDAVLEEIWGKLSNEGTRMHQEILNVVFRHSFTFLFWLIELKKEMTPLIIDGTDLAVNFWRDLIKIIKNDTESLHWKKIWARSDKFLANVDRLLDPSKKVVISLSETLIKLIKYNITSDIVKIINGGHVKVPPWSMIKSMVVWSKVKSALRNLNEKAKVKSLLLWMKLRPIADKVTKEYKERIIEALQHDGTIVLNDGTKIVISVIGDVVKVSIDDIDAVSGKLDVQQVR